jgi:hypothetical protein
MGGCSVTGDERWVTEDMMHQAYTPKERAGGGYIYGTTNVAFKGLPLERYLLMLDIRKQYGWYDECGNPCPALVEERDTQGVHHA